MVDFGARSGPSRTKRPDSFESKVPIVERAELVSLDRLGLRVVILDEDPRIEYFHQLVLL